MECSPSTCNVETLGRTFLFGCITVSLTLTWREPLENLKLTLVERSALAGLCDESFSLFNETAIGNLRGVAV